MPECTLCSLPTPEPPITDPNVDGEFCCQGCLAVERHLDAPESAVDAAAVRERAAATADDRVADRRDDSPVEGRSADGAEGETEFFAVEGMHCSTCEAFLEATATAQSGVESAAASYASDLLRVTYDPEGTGPAELSEQLSVAGYEVREPDEDAEEETDDALGRLIVGGLFGMMAMLYYLVFLYPTYLGAEPLVDLGGFDGLYLFGQLWVLTTLVLGYTGFPLLRGAVVSLRAGRPNMDLLVSTAAVAAYAYSTVAMVLGRTHLYFDVTVAIVLVVTAGTHYETRVKRSATALLSELAERRVSEATLYPSGETLPVEELTAGDRIRVAPGERVPVDGTVDEGVAAVDEALVTGESLPTTKRPGDDVRGGTVVTNAPVVVEVDEGATSTIDRLVETLWEIQSSRSGAQRLADRIATVFVPLVVVLAAVAVGATLLAGRAPTEALLVGLTVLIVACPCALGLATPLAVARGLRAAADRSIVVASAAAFETDPDVDVLAVDKTGTLTTGRMQVEAVEPIADDADASDLLRRAAALEAFSAHPVADAITDRVDDIPDDVDDVETTPRGIVGTVDGTETVVGHPALVASRVGPIDEAVADRIDALERRGLVPTVVAWDGRICGLLGVGDSERTEWDAVLSAVGESREVVVLTGDDPTAAERFRDHPAVDEVFAGVPPDGKAETIRRLGQDGRVAMVGDGSNDAPALAAADLGIAIGDGTELATDAADVVIADGDLRSIPAVLSILRGTRRRIRENLGWAFLYNAVAIPLAVTGLLSPLLAALAMATSSALVVLNSTREFGVDDAADTPSRDGSSDAAVVDSTGAPASPVAAQPEVDG